MKKRTTKNKNIYFFISVSILYICLIQFIHAIIYTSQIQKEQSTGTFFIDMLFYSILCMPMIFFIFKLIINNGLKTMPSLLSTVLKENWMIIILYFLLLYAIRKNCFSGNYLIDLFGKQMTVPEKQSSLLCFFYYLDEDYITLCIMGMLLFVGYLSLKTYNDKSSC